MKHERKRRFCHEEKQQAIANRNKKEMELFNKQQQEEIRKRKAMKKPYKHKDNIIKKKNKGMDLTREKDRDKIISAILLDKDLMKENEQTNRQLANAKGVNKSLKYELLQLEQQNQNKKKNNNKNKTKRIEDKLIEYGEALKQKRAQEKVDKLKSQEMSYSFKPTINKVNPEYMNKFNNKDFYSRLEYFEEQKENKKEQIKTTIVDPENAEYSFKPELTEKSKKLTRTIDHLYK